MIAQFAYFAPIFMFSVLHDRIRVKPGFLSAIFTVCIRTKITLLRFFQRLQTAVAIFAFYHLLRRGVRPEKDRVFYIKLASAHFICFI